jgi:hypothetical protein
MLSRVGRCSVLAVMFATAAVLVASAGAGTKSNADPTLNVTYAMNCTFTVTSVTGQPVTSIAPGAYQIQVTTPVIFAAVDLSEALSNPSDMTACRSFVQFQLSGPGVNVSSTLQDGDEDYELLNATFQPSSTYTAVDNNQPSVARVVFTTTASGTPQQLPNPEGTGLGASAGTSSQDIVGSDTSLGANATLRGSLDAIVYADGKVSLTHNGNAFTSLKSGKWTFAVEDESKKAGFDVQVLHGKAQTVSSGAFVGNNDVTVTLKPGRWSYFTPGGKKRDFFVTG